jgi:uncharacterized protein YbbC (DUF1343 family)
LREQVTNCWNEEQIRKSWETGLEEFKDIRQKYLLYPD